MSPLTVLFLVIGAFIAGGITVYLALRNNPKVKKALDTGVDYVETLKK